MKTYCCLIWNICILLIFITGFSKSLSSQDLLPRSGGEIIKHNYYTLSYNEIHEQANWVYYILTDDLKLGTVRRTNNFRSDPMVSTGSAIDEDYRGSGYDRGHLCPAEAMSFNLAAMTESFFYSNMSPQSGSFNRGKWKSLENKERRWAKSKGEIHVVSGPVFQNNIKVIGGNEVTVPGFYYKVIYEPEKAMIAFLMPNEKAKKSLDKYVVTVDWIEEITGIDFFEPLDNKKEALLEANSDPQLWGLNGQVISSLSAETGNSN